MCVHCVENVLTVLTYVIDGCWRLPNMVSSNDKACMMTWLKCIHIEILCYEKFSNSTCGQTLVTILASGPLDTPYSV